MAVVAALAGAVLGAVGVGPVAGANTPKPPKPTVADFAANPTEVGVAGGTITVSAIVANATNCTLSASGVSGLPTTFPCASGTVDQSVTLPVNRNKGPARYKLELLATGARTKKVVTKVSVAPTVKREYCWNFIGVEYLEFCDFAWADMAGDNLGGKIMIGAGFAFANLTGVSLETANLSQSGFNDANLTGADLSGALLTVAVLTGANLTGANLTDANLGGAVLTGVIWSNTTCPDGSNSDNDGGTCVNNLG